MMQATGQAVASAHSYPIKIELEYKLTVAGRPLNTGHGWTLSMSSTAIRFVPEKPLPRGDGIELSIAWPALLHDQVGLRLCIKGSVVESRTNGVTVQILRYEFRTRSMKAVGVQGVTPKREWQAQGIAPPLFLASR